MVTLKRFSKWRVDINQGDNNQGAVYLTWVGGFSPSVDFGASVDQYNVLKSYYCVMNLLVESNVLSKTGLGIEIAKFCAEL